MSQHDMIISNDTGANVRADINLALGALVTRNAGTSGPSPSYPYMEWPDTTNGVFKRRNAANSGWLIESTLGETRALARSSNTILGVADIGKFVIASSTYSQTLDAAATLGDGWCVDIRNDGIGVITLDPSGGDLIDSQTTVALVPGEACRIVCNGTGFKTFGRNIGGLVLIDTEIPASGGHIEFASGFDSAAYSHYLIKLDSYKPSVDGSNLLLTMSTNGGSSYASTGYTHTRSGWVAGSGVVSEGGSAASTSAVVITENIGNASGEELSGSIEIYTSTGRVLFEAVYKNAAGVLCGIDGRGFNAAAAVNGIKLAPNTGLITSGPAYFYGVRK